MVITSGGQNPDSKILKHNDSTDSDGQSIPRYSLVAGPLLHLHQFVLLHWLTSHPPLTPVSYQSEFYLTVSWTFHQVWNQEEQLLQPAMLIPVFVIIQLLENSGIVRTWLCISIQGSNIVRIYQLCILHLVVCVKQSYYILRLARQREFPFCNACARWVFFQIYFGHQQETKAKLWGGGGRESIAGPLSQAYGITQTKNHNTLVELAV